ncbi:MAG: hypothetical protein CMD82_05340 [Gammaproteobacteria bacterium]|nr:hypothetical protein [Gammaproteobacteria bacterium]|tara:strand:- start:1498 stop:1773 length:276 start_codon:yes stop_codon:yes gene_type:complete
MFMKIILNFLIVLSIAMSAFFVVYIKHLNRILNIEIEVIDRDLSNKVNEYKVLMNKKTRILNERLSDERLKENLGMRLPRREEVIYLNSVE